MMDPAALAALITAITGLVAAIGTVIGVWRHVTGPAHSTTYVSPPPPQPPKVP